MSYRAWFGPAGNDDKESTDTYMSKGSHHFDHGASGETLKLGMLLAFSRWEHAGYE